MDESVSQNTFEGFYYPEDDYFTRLPRDWFMECAQIDNIAELKVMLYLARHTWGFQEYDKWKRITIDEFVHGRFGGGIRMDCGAGLSEMSVRNGLKKAIEHGYILEKTNNRDRARIRKSYKLKMYPRQSEV